MYDRLEKIILKNIRYKLALLHDLKIQLRELYALEDILLDKIESYFTDSESYKNLDIYQNDPTHEIYKIKQRLLVNKEQIKLKTEEIKELKEEKGYFRISRLQNTVIFTCFTSDIYFEKDVDMRREIGLVYVCHLKNVKESVLTFLEYLMNETNIKFSLYQNHKNKVITAVANNVGVGCDPSLISLFETTYKLRNNLPTE